jgi:AcrR family transcriptional regulator
MEISSPKNRRFEKSRQGIISAAREIIRTEGVDALSMRYLAEKVDYSPSALYKYFNNKEEIIEALRREGWNQMEIIFRNRIHAGEPAAQRLVDAGLAYLELADRHPELYQLMFNSDVNPIPSMKSVENDPNFSVIPGIIRTGVESGEFSLPGDMTVLEYGYLAWFTMHGICMLKVTMCRDSLDEFDPLAREIIQKFIMASASQPKGDSSVK